MVTDSEAKKFAEEWISSWNTHNLEAILSHYSEDFEMSSPRIIEIFDEPSGTLKGKENVRAYWRKSLELSPNLRFELVDVLLGAGSLVILYKNLTRGKRAAEVFVLNPKGLVVKSMAHYA